MLRTICEPPNITALYQFIRLNIAESFRKFKPTVYSSHILKQRKARSKRDI